MKLVKKNEVGETYSTKNFKILYRKKGSMAGDNSINPKETIYFITGEAKITLEDKSWRIRAPEKVEFPANTYHKIESTTNTSFIILEK